ncbi:MAG: hypothetical protein AAF213_02735 [Pseudomonadota bacterium]
MAKPKSAFNTLRALSETLTAESLPGDDPTGGKNQPISPEQHSFLEASLNAACMDAADAGWETTIEAVELVLAAAAHADDPCHVSLETIKLAEAQINTALNEMQRVGRLTDRLHDPSPSPQRH